MATGVLLFSGAFGWWVGSTWPARPIIVTVEFGNKPLVQIAPGKP